MKLKTFFINQGVLLNDFKSFGWVGAVYLLGLLLSVPLKIIMLHNNTEVARLSQDPEIYLRIFLFSDFLQLMLLIIAPVLTALLLFGYLQNGKAADMAHALPVKREALYHTHILAGLIFLFVPLMITALAAWALVAGLGIPMVSGQDILTWLAISLLFNLLYFITGAATGMFTGLVSVQGVLSYILLLLPTGLSMLLLYNMSIYTYGFALDAYMQFVNISPLVKIFNCQIHETEIAAYLLASIALYLLGLYLYRRRQSEAAGSAITFDALRPLFKYGVTFCFMLFVGSYFYQTQNSVNWAYFGYLLGSLPAYFGVEILLHKSLHVFKPKIIKGFGIYALIVMVCIVILHLDLTGYERRLPELSEVESVYMDNVFYPLSHFNNEEEIRHTVNYQDTGIILSLETPPPVYTRAEDIARVYALHQKIVSNRAAEKAAMQDRYKYTHSIVTGERRLFYLVYNFKNGSHIYRQYNVDTSDYARQLKSIYESQEYKIFHNAVLSINPSEIKMLEINAEKMNKSVRIVDQKLIQQAAAALQSDIMKQTYEEMIADRPGWANINIVLKNNKATGLEWQKTYVDFEQWLKSINEYNNARLIARDDIQYAVVTKQTGEEKEAYQSYKMEPRQFLLNAESAPGHLKIIDPEKLEVCLRQYTVYRYSKPYNVIFLLKNGDSFIGGFTEDDAPPFVKEHFTR
jgi:ABC-2 type transport system permease protein